MQTIHTFTYIELYAYRKTPRNANSHNVIKYWFQLFRIMRGPLLYFQKQIFLNTRAFFGSTYWTELFMTSIKNFKRKFLHISAKIIKGFERKWFKMLNHNIWMKLDKIIWKKFVIFLVQCITCNVHCASVCYNEIRL